MATKIQWETVKGHSGLQCRKYGNDLSFRFRQRQHGIDFFGVMPLERAIRIAGVLRENRATGAGPQTFRDMQGEQREQAQKAAIVEKKERKRIIAEDRLTQANTVDLFWNNVYWPQRSKTGSAHNNKSVLGAYNKWILPIIGDISLQELTFTQIDNVFQNMHDKGMSAKTIDNVYTILQAEWNYAMIYLSTHNAINLPIFPGKMIKRQKLNNQKTCYLDPPEASLLLKTLYDWRQICQRHKITQKGKDTKDAYGMTVLSLLSGLRLGDICRLTWRDVETAFGYARTPKGGRQYGIHLDIPLVLEMLEERRAMFPDTRPDDFVFRDSRGNQWKEAPQSFEDAVEELGLNYTPRRMNNPQEKIDFHAMRHTFASWLAMAGTSLQTIMVLMGHESIQMTLRYARLNPAYTRQPVAEMAEGFARQHKLADGDYVYTEASPSQEIRTDIFALQQ